MKPGGQDDSCTVYLWIRFRTRLVKLCIEDYDFSLMFSIILRTSDFTAGNNKLLRKPDDPYTWTVYLWIHPRTMGILETQPTPLIGPYQHSLFFRFSFLVQSRLVFADFHPPVGIFRLPRERSAAAESQPEIDPGNRRTLFLEIWRRV